MRRKYICLYFCWCVTIKKNEIPFFYHLITLFPTFSLKSKEGLEKQAHFDVNELLRRNNLRLLNKQRMTGENEYSGLILDS